MCVPGARGRSESGTVTGPRRGARAPRVSGAIVAILVAGCSRHPSAGAPAGRAATPRVFRVGPGREFSDLRSIAALLGPGDRVEIEPAATPYLGPIVFTSSGAVDRPITVHGVRVGGARPVLAGGETTIEFRGDHYVLEGVEIVGGAARCLLQHGDDLMVRDSAVHDCPGHGILAADDGSGSLTLEGVEVFRCGDGVYRHPIYVATDESLRPRSVFTMTGCYLHDQRGGNNIKSRAERNDIRSNWVEGGFYRELELVGPDGQDPALAREDSIVVGNVFVKHTPGRLVRVGGDATGDTAGQYRFSYNTFVVAPESGSLVEVFDRVEAIEFDHNVVYRVGGGGVDLLDDEKARWVRGAATVTGCGNWLPEGSTAVPSTVAWSGLRPGALVDPARGDPRPDPRGPLTSGTRPCDAGDVRPRRDGFDESFFEAALASTPALRRPRSGGYGREAGALSRATAEGTY